MKVNPFTAFATNIVTLAIITLTLTTPSCCNIINVHYTLQEEQTAGSYIGNIVNDANLSSIFDQTSIRQLSFAFMGSSHFIDNFNLDPITGVMETGSKKLDRESMCEGMETCHISLDVGIKPPTFFRLIRIDINLLDINDHSPTFPSPLQVIEVSESAPVGSFYQLLLAQDPDSPTNSVANYRLSPFTPGSHDNFILDWEKAPTNPDLPASKQPPTPRLMLLRQLDREKQNLYYAELTAYDGANPPKVGKLRVEVRVMDANDNSPIFNPPSYQVTVKEDISVGSSIATVHAIDADEGLNGMVNYHFSPATNTAHGTIFHVNNRTGEITSISELDYEKKQSYQLVVEVMDSGADPVVVSTLVTVIVLDVNDNPPFITSQSMTSHDHYDAVLLEDTPAKTFVAHLTVADKDSGSGGAITCSLRGHSSPTSANLLSIDQMLTSAVSVFNLVRVSESEYQIETTMELNREVKEAYEFQVFCHDDGKPRLNSTKVVNVKVDDVNDCTPTFSTKMHTLDLYENNYPGVDVMRISADDCDVGENGRMTYSLLNQRDSFKIDRSTGLLTAEVSFDREVVGNKLSVKVVVKDNGNPQKSSNTKMVINILDINDNSPIFEKVAYQFNVTENLSAKTYVGSLKATDADKASSENSRVYYSILPGPSSNHFSISNLTGDLFTATKLDREMEVLHYLVVVAKDNGIPSLSSSTRVVVVVEDTNDNPPLFEVPNHNNLTIQLCSRAPHNYRVARFSAYDFDSEDNGRVVYGMDNDTLFMNGLGEIFHLHHTTGHLTLLSEDISGLDGRLLKLKIWAKDLARPPEVSLRSEAEVLVSINQSAPILINGKYIESGDWLLTLGYYDNYTNNKSGFVYFVLLSAFLFIVISVLLILFCVFCVIKIRRYTKSNTSCVRISNCDNYNCRTEAMKKMTTLPLSSTVNTELMMAVDGIEEGDEDDSHLVVEEIIDGNCSFIGGLNCKNISQLSDTSALHLNSKARTLDQLRLSTPQLPHHSSGYSCSSQTIDVLRNNSYNHPYPHPQHHHQQHSQHQLHHNPQHSHLTSLYHLQEQQQRLLNQQNMQQNMLQHPQQIYSQRNSQYWKPVINQHNTNVNSNYQNNNSSQNYSPNCTSNNSFSNNRTPSAFNPNSTPSQDIYKNENMHSSNVPNQQNTKNKANKVNNVSVKSDQEKCMEAESEVKHLLSILKDEAILESTSLSSDQGGNSDSGKGASEEGGDVFKNQTLIPASVRLATLSSGPSREISRSQCSTDC